MLAPHTPHRIGKKVASGKKSRLRRKKTRLPQTHYSIVWEVCPCLRTPLSDSELTVGAQYFESTEKVGKGAILPFFLQITYGHSQLSIIGGECFFVVGGVRAFGGEALAQVVDFVVVLLKKKGGLFV